MDAAQLRRLRNGMYRRETKEVITFFENFSEKIQRILSRHEIHTINKSNNKFNELIKLGKDPLFKEGNAHVVYRLNCTRCLKNYVGQSNRSRITRASEREDNITKSPGEWIVITLHRIDNHGHEFDWNDPQILDSEPLYNKRLIAGMFHIQMNSDGLNIGEDTENLCNLYKNFDRSQKTEEIQIVSSHSKPPTLESHQGCSDHVLVEIAPTLTADQFYYNN
ncbi:hypothetical protein QAD02_001975 [Eretmocerus hayati]|uniref:Uncharacterized protein n=1 Tax=Eretmocerus hayati TaxID=131215 RepID=A0ACC2NHY8_9HYME|nr:hypothetical protein QAD02_001975 [Eretmocerus hayati]